MGPQAAASSEGIDNFQLPKALVTRIAKSALPHDAKLQKDTISTLVNSATVFINYLAATAQDVASSRSRKTIAGPDILKALEIIEFGDLVPLLQGELEAYRGIGKTDKGKAKAADVKGRGQETSSAASDTFNAQPNVAFPAGENHPLDLEHEPEPQMLENVEEREEGGFDEDVAVIEADARDEDEEEQEEEEEADEDIEDEAADEPEEVVDMIATEQVELQMDQQGLEESTPKNSEE